MEDLKAIDGILSDNMEMVKSSLALVKAKCHAEAAARGWWDKERNDGELIALMHSEVSEALEAIRTDAMDRHLTHRKGVEVELADVLIRVLDFAGARDLDVEGALFEKLEYNRTRWDHSKEAREGPGGKRI